MLTKYPIILLCGFALTGLSACGGGSSDDQARVTELEDRLAESEADRKAAEEAAAAASAAAAEAETAKRVAEEARRQAEAVAQQDAAEAEAAEREAAEAEERARTAETERQRLEQEATEAAARAAQGDARRAIVGLRSTTTAVGAVVVTPRYSALAGVTATPTGGSAVNFASKTRSSASGWSVTTLSNSGFTHNDDLVVYSNRGAPTRILLTQEYSTRFTDDGDSTANSPMSGDIVDSDARLIRAGSFPTTDGDDRSFSNNYENDDTNEGLDIVRLSGTFHGASGYFHCAASETTACTIGRRGDRYTIVSGSWTFHTTDTARALVDDKSYVHFGWWKRERKSDETQSFQTFSDGMSMAHSATTGGAFNALGGSATYRGPAIGHYSIYQPLGTQSASGSFTASAALTANFDSNMLSGTVSGFSNNPDWSVTLNSASMAGGDVDDNSGTTDWTIVGNTSRRQGQWDATFYSEAPYVGQVPDVVIGEFTAIYDADDSDTNGDVGRMTGAFGATKQ